MFSIFNSTCDADSIVSYCRWCVLWEPHENNLAITSHAMNDDEQPKAWMETPVEWSARSDFKTSLICIEIFSVIVPIIWLWAVTMWHHEDWESIAVQPEKKYLFYRRDLFSHVEKDSLESSNCGLFMNFLCSFTFFISFCLIYRLMKLRTPKKGETQMS